MWESSVTTTPIVSVFPWVTFTCSRQQKTFCIPRESIIHVETFQDKNSNEVDDERTYVNFSNPNPAKGSPLHAVVEMSVDEFREAVLRPAWTPRQP